MAQSKTRFLKLYLILRTRFVNLFLDEITAQFPHLKYSQIPEDFKAFNCASENKSALYEVARNSLARKSIATLT